MAQERECGKAAELALQEVLGSIQAAMYVIAAPNLTLVSSNTDVPPTDHAPLNHPSSPLNFAK